MEAGTISDQKIDVTLQSLNFLIGKWNSEGEMKTDNGDPDIHIQGTDSYEYALDNSFILHRVDVMIGNDRTEVIELISFDDQTKNYVLRSFDNQGAFSEMQAYIKKTAPC